MYKVKEDNEKTKENWLAFALSLIENSNGVYYTSDECVRILKVKGEVV